AAYCSSYVARLRRSDFIAATYALSLVLANFGIAMAARMPMMTTTISSSMSVNPFRLRDMVFGSSTDDFSCVRLHSYDERGECRATENASVPTHFSLRENP